MVIMTRSRKGHLETDLKQYGEDEKEVVSLKEMAKKIHYKT